MNLFELVERIESDRHNGKTYLMANAIKERGVLLVHTNDFAQQLKNKFKTEKIICHKEIEKIKNNHEPLLIDNHLLFLLCEDIKRDLSRFERTITNYRHDIVKMKEDFRSIENNYESQLRSLKKQNEQLTKDNKKLLENIQDIKNEQLEGKPLSITEIFGKIKNAFNGK